MTSLDPASNFSFTIEMVRGGLAAQRLTKLRLQQSQTGLLPLILGEAPEGLKSGDTIQLESKPTSPEPQELTAAEWFRERWARDAEVCESLDNTIYEQAAVGRHTLAVGFDHQGREIEVLVVLVDVTHAWELPLRLQYGDWNACPKPEEHALVAKYWEEEFGAEIAVMTEDTVEFTVARPPTDPETCLKLAREMYVYCSDIVDQGVGSIPTLAKALESSTTWFFWWD